jgi:hypothetical protein
MADLFVCDLESAGRIFSFANLASSHAVDGAIEGVSESNCHTQNIVFKIDIGVQNNGRVLG